MLLVAALAIAVVAVVAAGFAMRGSRRAHVALREANGRLARIDSVIPAAETEDSYGAEALQRDNRVKLETRDGERDLKLLSQFLADYRDVAGAEEAIFWRWSAERDALMPVAWSSEGPRPAYFDVAEWAPLVQWAAEGDVVQTVGQDETVFVGAACVRHDEELLGVLSLTHHTGLGLQRTALKDWLPRLAAQLASFHELMGMRRRYAGHMRQSQALLDAVQRLQGDKSGEGLVRSLCETALDVSGARGAALIRWDSDGDTGELHYATEGTGLRNLSPLDPASVAATVCRTGRLHVLEDARGAASGQALYGVSRVIREPGSVAIIPITKEGRTLGALVLEADEPGAFTQEEARPLTILGAVVSGSLELAWSFAEVDRRARTDPLTGLFNRLHFGEQLQRMLSEADRDKHGQPLSLVVVDIDHFKRVNDSWGHEAGDAVLKHVARILQEGVRTVDVCVRYGGEEIAILMGQTTSEVAVEVAERLRQKIAETPLRHGGASIAVTASFGVAAYPETVKVRDQLFPAADKALYIAKHEGRNCVKAKPATKGRTAT
jgi:diguanylate cyclase (GGDEF)-like protein